MDRDYRYRRYYRPSFFFPIALITAGVIWLLVNNGAIPVDNIYRLLPYWPVLLILAGISLLLRRIWWPLNALLWAGAAVLLVWMLIAPPAFLPQTAGVELRHDILREPIGQARSAAVNLNLSINATTVHATSNSQDLIVADLYSINPMYLDASGNEQKNVALRERAGSNTFFFNLPFAQLVEGSKKTWDIGLTNAIPLKLTVDASTGHTTLDLTGLKLDSLDIKASTGGMEVNLPEGGSNLPFVLDASTGGTIIRVPQNTPVNMNINGSTGGIQIEVPDGAGVQVNVQSGGPGSLNLPGGFTKVSGSADSKEGIWENSAYAGAKAPIRILLDLSTGSVTIQ